MDQMRRAVGTLTTSANRVTGTGSNVAFPGVDWPSRGLVLVQFRGSWDTLPVNHPAQLQRSHWVAVQEHRRFGPFVFDINSVGGMVSCMGPGWDPYAAWAGVMVPQLAESFGRKATGEWWVRAGIAIEPAADG